ncbi:MULTISPECIES: hypothetical protein [Niallia]|nr:hypothetical protein [Niallia circulans]
METIAFNDFMKEFIRKKNTTHPKVEIRNQFRIKGEISLPNIGG